MTLGSFWDGLAAVAQNRKYGFIDASGNVVINCQWDYASGFMNGISMVFKGKLENGYPSEGMYGFINTSGEYIAPCKYTDAIQVNETLFLLKDNYLTILDKNGNRIF